MMQQDYNLFKSCVRSKQILAARFLRSKYVMLCWIIGLSVVINVTLATTLNAVALQKLIERCAPNVHPHTLTVLTSHESNFEPFSIHINGQYQLPHQPRTQREAIQTTQWLLRRGFNFDVGLGQINSANFSRLNLNAKTVFDPCINLHAANTILSDCYTRASHLFGKGALGLKAALSCYNTGHFKRGVQNGYVKRVIEAATMVPDISLLGKTSTPLMAVQESSVSTVLPESSMQTTNQDHDLFEQPDTDVFQSHPQGEHI